MMTTAPLSSDPFATIGQLPLHPLVVHVPVVVLPVTALLLILAAVLPAVRRRFLGLGVLGAVVGLIGTYLSLRSGQAFAEIVGLPAAHAAAAQRLLWAAVALWVLSAAWWLLARRSGRDVRRQDAPDRDVSAPDAAEGGAAPAGAGPARSSSTGALPTLLGAVTAVASVLVLIFALQTGHSGARAAWSGVVSETSADAAQQGAEAAAPSESAAPSASSAEGATGYTMEEVAAHDSADTCWTVIDGQVYDLTEWIGRHPGGQRAIQSLCGVDGTAAFQSNHSGDQRAADQLSEFEIGSLTS